MNDFRKKRIYIIYYKICRPTFRLFACRVTLKHAVRYDMRFIIVYFNKYIYIYIYMQIVNCLGSLSYLEKNLLSAQIRKILIGARYQTPKIV